MPQTRLFHVTIKRTAHVMKKKTVNFVQEVE